MGHKKNTKILEIENRIERKIMEKFELSKKNVIMFEMNMENLFVQLGWFRT